MKKSFRSKYLAQRNKLSQKEVDDFSHKISLNLLSIPEYLKVNNYMVYLDFRKEVKTEEIIKNLLSQNKTTVIPISNPHDTSLELSRLTNFSDLVISTYGILEPRKDRLDPFPPEKIDIIIVPGVVFDRNGYRIGYGKGYYDRFLSNLNHDFTTIGICYDLQLIDMVPKDEYDFQLDYIVTDKEILKIK